MASITKAGLEWFSAVVQDLFKDLGCKTARDAEAILGISHGTLRRWINQEIIQLPEVDTLEKLASATQYTVQELVAGLCVSEVSFPVAVKTARDAWANCVSSLSRNEKGKLAKMIIDDIAVT